MFEETQDITPKTFWKIHRHEKKLCQKKQGISRFLYLFLFKWFQNYKCFPRTIDEIPLDILNHGFVLLDEVFSQEELIKLFSQTRLINRYKKEIRDHFGFKSFSEQLSSFQTFLSENVFKEKNEEVLYLTICDFLKKSSIEIPSKSTLKDVCERAKVKKETTVFNEINTLLIENLLQEDYWCNRLKEEDYRALTPLFYLHINPYGSFEVDLEKRIPLTQHVSFNGESL